VMNQVMLILPFYLNDDELIMQDLEKLNSLKHKNTCAI